MKVEEAFSDALSRLEVHFPDNIKNIEDWLTKAGGIFKIILFINENLIFKDYFPTLEGEPSKARNIWNDIGYLYRLLGRTHDALLIYNTEYSNTIDAQIEMEERIHKGAVLYWISECFMLMNYYSLSKKYMMLALCEDAITLSGKINTDSTGTYHRLVWEKKMSKEEYSRYEEEFWRIYLDNPELG